LTAKPWSNSGGGVTAGLVAAMLLATGCTARTAAQPARAAEVTPTVPGATAGSTGSTPGAPSSAAGPATIALRVGVLPGERATDVPLDSRVVVRAAGGTLASVVVRQVGGGALQGALAADDTSWTSAQALAPGAKYAVDARAVNAAGAAASRTWNFTTLTPATVLTTSVAPLDGEVVGIGMPVVVYFNRHITDRAAVEKRLKVTTRTPLVGSWYWLNDKEVHFRPYEYWPPGERVHVDINLAGVKAGDGLWGTADRSLTFSIGESHVSVVSALTHTMTVSVAGQPVRTFNVSTGRDTFPTSSGVHVVVSTAAVHWMDSATIGIPRDAPGGYFKRVTWNTRISNSGEFVHAAPWSVGSQGRRNVSHGCVNAGVAEARWFMYLSRRGDIVEVVGTPKHLRLGNGFADWVVPWDEWVSGSALAV
jgi:lipoprotein-anchoring transpeptidase ErfK/SrfK